MINWMKDHKESPNDLLRICPYSHALAGHA